MTQRTIANNKSNKLSVAMAFSELRLAMREGVAHTRLPPNPQRKSHTSRWPLEVATRSWTTLLTICPFRLDRAVISSTFQKATQHNLPMAAVATPADVQRTLRKLSDPDRGEFLSFRSFVRSFVSGWGVPRPEWGVTMPHVNVERGVRPMRSWRERKCIGGGTGVKGTACTARRIAFTLSHPNHNPLLLCSRRRSVH
jgi:hypothetical protein